MKDVANLVSEWSYNLLSDQLKLAKDNHINYSLRRTEKGMLYVLLTK
jgi:hypothetical protein